jgi:hypothetical protein
MLCRCCPSYKELNAVTSGSSTISLYCSVVARLASSPQIYHWHP